MHEYLKPRWPLSLELNWSLSPHPFRAEQERAHSRGEMDLMRVSIEVKSHLCRQYSHQTHLKPLEDSDGLHKHHRQSSTTIHLRRKNATHNRPLSSVCLAHVICFVLLTYHDIQPSSAASSECNFEKYTTGCYSQANFVCDRDTNLCRCHPDTPILIEQRVCVKRAKANEQCHYNEQCDIANGYYCTYNNYNIVNGSFVYDSSKDFSGESRPRCQNLNSTRHKYRQQSFQQQQVGKQNQISAPIGSNLPRLLWIFLVGCLLGLIALLLLIKSQYYRIGQSFHQQEDRISISSEIDEPPPYEIAIRMKL